MTAAESSVIVQANKAHENYEQTIQAKLNIAANWLVLARLFKESRDQSLYKLLGFDDFNDYLGSPELGFSRAKVYGLIQIWELYVDRLKISQRDILEVGNSKLLMLAPVVESAPEEWIAKGKALSKSDLRVEITGQAAGDKKLSPQSPPPSPSARPAGCCICGAKEWEKHHFPLTRGAGGLEHWWIPTCRACHSEYHQDPVKWTLAYKMKWAKYLYDDRNA